MKNYIPLILLSILLITGACKDNNQQSDEFTENKVTYTLYQADDDYGVQGSVTFRERLDGSAAVVVQVSGTEGENYHPLHLHYGPIDGDGEIAAVLNPVYGGQGESKTTLSTLGDGSAVTYQDLMKMEASIKIHLSGIGDESKIVLAGGNIGKSHDKNPVTPDGTINITVCKSN